jgi:hypothetical protein
LVPLANGHRAQNSRARAPNFVSFARASRKCAQQKNFAQFAVREGVEGPESIKKERISAG